MKEKKEPIRWDRKNLLTELFAAGFDQSRKDNRGVVLVGCSRCEAISLQGTPMHMVGCPNVVKKEHAGREPYEYEEE